MTDTIFVVVENDYSSYGVGKLPVLAGKDKGRLKEWVETMGGRNKRIRENFPNSSVIDYDIFEIEILPEPPKEKE